MKRVPRGATYRVGSSSDIEVSKMSFERPVKAKQLVGVLEEDPGPRAAFKGEEEDEGKEVGEGEGALAARKGKDVNPR
jgi:hypothetical protein